jgi:sec-independent protein translocase protein TatA
VNGQAGQAQGAAPKVTVNIEQEIWNKKGTTPMPIGPRLPELMILLAVVLIFFGAKRLPEMGASIGKSIKAFKKGMTEPVEDEEALDEETKALEAKRQELDALERELAAKKAQAAAYEAHTEAHTEAH